MSAFLFKNKKTILKAKEGRTYVYYNNNKRSRIQIKIKNS